MKTDIAKRIDEEKQREQNEFDLREMALYYGGWDELRKVIARLEDNDNEAAWERRMSDYDAPSIQEQSEKAYKQKYS